MAAVAQERNPVTSADPSGDRLAIADLPVQAALRHLDGGLDPRVQVHNVAAHLVHVARLEPRLLDVTTILVCEDPVELLAVPQRVLYDMHVLTNPDIDAFLLHEFATQRDLLQVGTLEEGTEAGVAG